MRTTILLYFILNALTTEAQINLDSLRQQLENSTMWTKTKTIDYLMQPFQRFERVDHLESFDLYIDSTGRLNEYIGLTAVYKQFDNQNRIIKRIGYNLKGNYYLWDYSPIELTEYNHDTTKIDYYNYLFILKERLATVRDTKNRIIEELRYDKNLKLYSKVVYQYRDKKNKLLITTFDGNGIIKCDKFGVGIKLQKFDSENSKLIIEERFYDTKMNLIDARHNLSDTSFFKCEYSILKREFKDKEEITSYFNSKNELQCQSNRLGSIWRTK